MASCDVGVPAGRLDAANRSGRPFVSVRLAVVRGISRPGIHLGEGLAAVIVHGHEDKVPAGASGTLRPVTSDALADLVEAPHFLISMCNSSRGLSRS